MSTDPATPTFGHPAPAPRAARPTAMLQDAGGPSYAGEWALFCDYTTATGQPALPTTVAALAGFLTALPARPATLARRVRAIAAAHRHAGHLLARPDHGPAAPTPVRLPRQQRAGAGPLIAACPTRGWPHGLHGRRDAFLIVATVVLGLSHTAVRALTPVEMTLDASPDGSADASDGATVAIGGQTVPEDPDPRQCPACAVVRWLDLLGVLDGLGRGSARMQLAGAHAPLPDSPHQHHAGGPKRWRGTATLLPAIDQHGWLDDFRPITTRTIRTRLNRAVTRATLPGPQDRPPVSSADPTAGGAPDQAPLGHSSPSLDEVLTLLDGVADDAEALNTRIQALLNDHL